MKILYISQYYPPEMGAPAARVSELAREWRRRGHEVTVLTAFPHHPHGQKRPQDRFVLTRRETDGAIQLVRTYVFATRNAGFLLRTLSYLSFMLSAMLIGMFRVGKPDVVIATSPQLFTGVAGWWISRIRRVPFVFEVRDLWPESIVTVGAMRESLAIRLLKRLAAWLYRAADRIVTVGGGYRRRILANYRVVPDKIDVVTNGVDLDRFVFDPQRREQTRTEFGWRDQSVVMYLGTHGMAHGLDFVLEAAECMRENSRLHFVFVGDGAEKPNLQKMADEKKLTNVQFVGPQDKDRVIDLYAAADICLVPLRKVDLFTDVLPSKLFEIMAMRRPIVISVDGDARVEVENARAGLFAEPENVADLCAAIERIHADAAMSERMGQSGRRYVEEFFSRAVLARRYLTILDNLTNGTTDSNIAPVLSGT